MLGKSKVSISQVALCVRHTPGICSILDCTKILPSPTTASLLGLMAMAMDAWPRMKHRHWQVRLEGDLQHGHFTWDEVHRGQLRRDAVGHNLISHFQLRS